YSSLFDDGNWSTPLNMGYPINTPDDDKFYVPAREGYFAYYSLFAESGYGKMDIFSLEIFSDEHPRKFRVSGIVSLNQTPVGFQEKIQIYVTDSEKNDTINSLKASDSGEYNFVIEAGEYDLNFVSQGFEPFTQHLSLPLGSTDTIIVVPETTLSLIDISANLVLVDSVINVDSDTVKIDLEVEPGSILIVDIFGDSSLISSEEFYITDSLYTYTYNPELGGKRIKFTLTDQYGNTASNELLIPIPIYIAMDDFEDEMAEEILDEIIVEEMIIEEIAIDSSAILDTEEVKAFKEVMTVQAEGNLKETLEKLDIEKEEIYSTYELVSFLGDNAELLGYTEEELAVLLALIAAEGNPDVEEFIANFSPYTNGGLQPALNDLSNQKKIKNIEDLIQKLLKSKSDYNFSSSDLMNALITMISDRNIDMTSVKDYINKEDKSGLGTGGNISVWLLGLTGTFLIFLLYRKRKRKNEE
ncbi:MAG: hypothetical protein QNK30_17105, partial [Bacteroidales bacterium]|nr:hypothetical protein [Bacteroidales bacterium]